MPDVENPNVKELMKYADDILDLQKAGVLREMSPVENERLRKAFPYAEMILGNYIITKIT